MIGKTHATPETPFALPGFGVLELSGRDAQAFLHAQAMNDVRALADGQWQWNGVLSPKGRVLALFALLRLAPERFWAVSPDVAPSALEAHFRRYLFRSRVQLTARDDLHAAGTLAAPGDASGPQAAERADGLVALDLGGARPRTLLLQAAGADEDAARSAEWLREDLRHGLPRLGEAQLDAWTPQMLSLERLRAFSLTKGCYPGQEIVARTHYLGQAKRVLQLLTVAADAAAGDAIQQDERRCGELVCVAPAEDSGMRLALAVLPADAAEAGLSVRDAPATRQPLQPGLAR